MILRLSCGGDVLELAVTREADLLNLRLPDGDERTFTVRQLGGVMEIEEGGRVFRVPFARYGEKVVLCFQGRTFSFSPATSPAADAAAREVSGKLVSPMMGTVAELLVKEGDRVGEYQPIVRVEAMKVLATVEAPFAGTVGKLHVRRGDRVALAAPLAEIEAD